MVKLKDDPEDDSSSQEDQKVLNITENLGAQGSSESEVDGTHDAINREKLVKKKKIILTPCNHKYHINCFKSWINIKLECPSCRNTLKPLVD